MYSSTPNTIGATTSGIVPGDRLSSITRSPFALEGAGTVHLSITPRYVLCLRLAKGLIPTGEKTDPSRHSRESGNPCAAPWMPGFAGMTGRITSRGGCYWYRVAGTAAG